MVSVSGRKYECRSGAILTIRPAPFAEARAVFQAYLRQLHGMNISPSNENDVIDLIRTIFTAGYASPEIEATIEKCMKYCTYTGQDGIDSKLDDHSFDDVECRQDYLGVVREVAIEAVTPFFKSLVPEFKAFMNLVAKFRE